MKRVEEIYPNIKESQTGSTYICETVLRLRYKGKYYLQYFKSYSSKEELSRMMLLRDVYSHMKFGKVDLSLQFQDGSKMYQLDDYQFSEFVRLGLISKYKVGDKVSYYRGNTQNEGYASKKGVIIDVDVIGGSVKYKAKWSNRVERGYGSKIHTPEWFKVESYISIDGE